MPALLTSTSMRPKAESVSLTIWSNASGFDRSACSGLIGEGRVFSPAFIDVDSNNVESGLRQAERHGSAHAAGGAGDDCGLTV